MNASDNFDALIARLATNRDFAFVSERTYADEDGPESAALCNRASVSARAHMEGIMDLYDAVNNGLDHASAIRNAYDKNKQRRTAILEERIYEPFDVFDAYGQVSRVIKRHFVRDTNSEA